MSKPNQHMRKGRKDEGTGVLSVDLNDLPPSGFSHETSNSSCLPSEVVSTQEEVFSPREEIPLQNVCSRETREEASQQDVPIINLDESDGDESVFVPPSHQVTNQPHNGHILSGPKPVHEYSFIDIFDEDSDNHQASPGTVSIHENIPWHENFFKCTANDGHPISLGLAIHMVVMNRTLSNHQLIETIIKTSLLLQEKEKKPEIHEIPESPPKMVVNLTCAVCHGELVDSTSTKCGHIFCYKCIKAAIREQKKCPICRTNLHARSIHRVYLPRI